MKKISTRKQESIPITRQREDHIPSAFCFLACCRSGWYFSQFSSPDFDTTGAGCRERSLAGIQCLVVGDRSTDKYRHDPVTGAFIEAGRYNLFSGLQV